MKIGLFIILVPPTVDEQGRKKDVRIRGVPNGLPLGHRVTNLLNMADT